MAEILVIEDDVDIAVVISEVLAAEGHSVVLALDGGEGLVAATSSHPDLLVMDVGLPSLTGPEVACRMFIHDAGLEEIPIILASANRDLQAIAAKVGTPYYLAKPFSVSQLSEMVSRALAERRPPTPVIRG